MSALEFEPMAKTAMSLSEVAFRNLLAERIEPGQRPGLLLQAKVAKQAAAACTVLACLAIAAVFGDVEGWPTQGEYAEYWTVTDRHAQNEWALFRRAFPGEESPDRIAKLMVAEHLAKVRQARADFAGPLPAQSFGISVPALA